MTVRQLSKRITDWVDRLPQLCLAGWRFNIRIEDDDDDMGEAKVAWHSQYNHATITISESFLREYADNDEEIDRVIMHELLHLVFRDMETLVREFEDHVPKAVWTILFDSQFDDRQERLVELLAEVIVMQHYHPAKG